MNTVFAAEWNAGVCQEPCHRDVSHRADEGGAAISNPTISKST